MTQRLDKSVVIDEATGDIIIKVVSLLPKSASMTATIVMDNTLINSVDYGDQRDISDIIYFATALPEVE